MLGVRGLGVALGDSRLEALEVRLDGAREEPVLGPLPEGTGVALAL